MVTSTGLVVGAVVAWSLASILVKVLTGVFDPVAPSWRSRPPTWRESWSWHGRGHRGQRVVSAGWPPAGAGAAS